MYETGRRAYETQALHSQRLDWRAHLPDTKEAVDLETLPDTSGELSWFQIKNCVGFQPPSVVLVERVISRDDVAAKVRRHKPKRSTVVSYGSRLGGDKGRGERTVKGDVQQKGMSDSDGTFRQSSGTGRRRIPGVQQGVERTFQGDWRHSNVSSYQSGAQTIEQGLARDGLGHLPPIASSLGVIRRLELDAEGFFTFLFSNRWKDGCLLRVLKGQLLDSLLHVLTTLQKYHNLISFTSMAYIYNNRHVTPCNKMAPKTRAAEVLEERILVELDYFYPQHPPEFITQKLHELDLSTFSLSKTETVTNDDETPNIRCNIRGQTKPPPHRNCLRPFHVHREPFLLRRYREQSAFPQPLPPVPTETKSPLDLLPQKTSGNNPQDDAFLGPKLSDNSEVVASDVLLTPISALLEGNGKSSQLNSETSVPSKRCKEESQKSRSPPKSADGKKKKKNKKGESSDDEDEDMQGDSEIRSCVDPSRVEGIQKDIDWMTTELVAKQPVPKREKTGLEIRLKRTLRIKRRAKQDQDKRLQTVTSKGPAAQQTATAQPTLEDSTKQWEKTPSEKPAVVVCPPHTFMKKWDKCPDFTEFCQYLQQEQLVQGAAKKKPPPASKKVMKDNFAPAGENSTTTDKQEKKGQSKDSARKSSKPDKAKKKSTQQAQDTDQNKTEVKTTAKRKGKDEVTSRLEAMTLAASRAGTPYVYVNDSEIPDDISDSIVFGLLQVDQHFNSQKLKSSYSFEKMFAHRTHEVDNYAKLLSFFSKPLPQKKAKPVQKKSSPKRTTRKMSRTAKSPASEVAKNPVSVDEPEELFVDEPTSPPMVIGKLRHFKFLQHKNFSPNLASAFSSPVLHTEMSPADISQLLILAMQKFVVRKERASTIFGSCQCSSKVSLTFSKRAPGDNWLGVPPAV